MSEAKAVETDMSKQPDNRAKGEASVLIISISTKTIVELFGAGGNKNLLLAEDFLHHRSALYQGGNDPRTKRKDLLFFFRTGRLRKIASAAIWNVRGQRIRGASPQRLFASTPATLNCREANRPQNRRWPFQRGLKPFGTEDWPRTQPMKHGAIENRAVRIENS